MRSSFPLQLLIAYSFWLRTNLRRNFCLTHCQVIAPMVNPLLPMGFPYTNKSCANEVAICWKRQVINQIGRCLCIIAMTFLAPKFYQCQFEWNWKRWIFGHTSKNAGYSEISTFHLGNKGVTVTRQYQPLKTELTSAIVGGRWFGLK